MIENIALSIFLVWLLREKKSSTSTSNSEPPADSGGNRDADISSKPDPGIKAHVGYGGKDANPILPADPNLVDQGKGAGDASIDRNGLLSTGNPKVEKLADIKGSNGEAPNNVTTLTAVIGADTEPVDTAFTVTVPSQALRDAFNALPQADPNKTYADYYNAKLIIVNFSWSSVVRIATYDQWNNLIELGGGVW